MTDALVSPQDGVITGVIVAVVATGISLWLVTPAMLLLGSLGFALAERRAQRPVS
jgi:hypothetical protein